MYNQALGVCRGLAFWVMGWLLSGYHIGLSFCKFTKPFFCSHFMSSKAFVFAHRPSAQPVVQTFHRVLYRRFAVAHEIVQPAANHWIYQLGYHFYFASCFLVQFKRFYLISEAFCGFLAHSLKNS